MRFASLGSGSKGNATLFEYKDTCILIDCGFNARETEKRLTQLDKSPKQISAILVTHEHHDHISGVGPLARKYNIPTWMTRGTFLGYNKKRKQRSLPKLEFFNCHQTFQIDDIKVEPFPVPHDAHEASQFIIHSDKHKVAMVTDTGHVTSHMVNTLSDCDGCLLEFNHDLDMLKAGPYPYQLKQRVGGNYGHLNNNQAIELLKKINHPGLEHIVAMHISQENNCPEKVANLLKNTLNTCSDRVLVAAQEQSIPWRSLS